MMHLFVACLLFCLTSAQYACKRPLTELTDNGMGMDNTLEWTYDATNYTLSVRLTTVARIGWSGIGITRKEHVGMDKGLFMIGFYYSDGVVHERVCLRPYLGSGNGHPLNMNASLSGYPSFWDVISARQNNEQFMLGFSINTNSLPFVFEASNTKVLIATLYSSQTFGLQCPLSGGQMGQHASRNAKPANIALVHDWTQYNGQGCAKSNIGAPTNAPTNPTGTPASNTPTQGNGSPPPGPTPSMTPTTAPGGVCASLGSGIKVEPSDACRNTTGFLNYDTNAQVCIIDQCRCLGSTYDGTRCNAQTTCGSLTCAATKFNCLLNVIRGVAQAAPCAPLLAPYLQASTTECLREVCQVSNCQQSQYTNACNAVGTSAGSRLVISPLIFASSILFLVLLGF